MTDDKKGDKKEEKRSWFAEHPGWTFLIILVVAVSLYIVLVMPVCVGEETRCAGSSILTLRFWLLDNIGTVLILAIVVGVASLIFKRAKLFRNEYSVDDIVRMARNKTYEDTGGQYVAPPSEVEVKELLHGSNKFLVNFRTSSKIIPYRCLVFDPDYKGFWREAFFDDPDHEMRRRNQDVLDRANLSVRNEGPV